MRAGILVSLPDTKVHPPLTEGKVYEVRSNVGNGVVLLADDMKSLVIVLAERVKEI